MYVSVRCSDEKNSGLETEGDAPSTNASEGTKDSVPKKTKSSNNFVSKITRTEHSGDVIAAYMISKDSYKESKMWIKHTKWQIQGMTSDHLGCLNQ